jgi:hypothetical protein
MLHVGTRVHLGNGAAWSFWHDHWLYPQPLAALFPMLYSHCSRPNIIVQGATAGTGLGVPGTWDCMPASPPRQKPSSSPFT